MAYCENCGAELSASTNFCPYCGTKIAATTASISLLNKAVSTANLTDQYNLVLVSRGNVDAVTAGDILEDTFGYTDAESVWRPQFSQISSVSSSAIMTFSRSFSAWSTASCRSG